MIRDKLLATIRYVGALLFAGAFFWQVAQRTGPRECEAVVHVTETDVDVTIDDAEYRVESWEDATIVRDLRPGSHTLRMSRGGRMLYEQSFIACPGADLVLTAWDEAGQKAMQLTQPSPLRRASGNPAKDVSSLHHAAADASDQGQFPPRHNPIACDSGDGREQSLRGAEGDR